MLRAMVGSGEVIPQSKGNRMKVWKYGMLACALLVMWTGCTDSEYFVGKGKVIFVHPSDGRNRACMVIQDFDGHRWCDYSYHPAYFVGDVVAFRGDTAYCGNTVTIIDLIQVEETK